MHLICLHNVIAAPLDSFDEKCSRISVEEFERFLDAVSERFRLVSFRTYQEHLRQGWSDPDMLALSFDDGFRGVFDFARPVLDARGLDAIAFINPPYLGNPAGDIFHFLELEIAFRLSDCTDLRVSFCPEPLDLSAMKPRVKALKRIKKLLKTRPEAQRVSGHAEVLAALGISRQTILDHAARHKRFHLMDPEQLGALSNAGWVIGSHGMTHRTLSMLPTEELHAEFDAARRFFFDTFGWEDMPFAYPYGDVIHVGDIAPLICAQAGYPFAFTTVPGPSDMRGAPHLLPRIDYKRFLRDHDLRISA